jgi:putative FmdB family regulatory protein
MPTYEYVCTSCDTPLEVVQSIHDPSITDCPSCDEGRLRKIFGNVGVVFKGSGFYRTDSRGKSTASSPGSKPETKDARDSKDSKDSKKASEPVGAGATTAGSSGSGAGSAGSPSTSAASPKTPAGAAS